jgi:ketosteroid isomerase-like protein
MRTGAALGRSNARRDHPEARGTGKTPPDRGRIESRRDGVPPSKICCVMYVSIYTIRLNQLKEENDMPSRARVAELVSYVQAGKYVEAISDFYAETALMKENHGEPRTGRDNLIKHERAVLAGLAQMRTERVGAVLVDGDHVVINWVFEMTTRDGKKRLLDELALQKWSGERIVEEHFYYDPAQLRPAS